MSSRNRMLKRGPSVLIRLFSSSSASASLRTTVVSSRAMRPTMCADARAAVVLVEVARHALLQVARLADVEHGVVARRNSDRRPAAAAARPLRRAAARAHRRTSRARCVIGRGLCRFDNQRGMRWDLFCRVIDNCGDLGVCWRLAADLASRGEPVRLWVDDAAALHWMAPRRRMPASKCVPWSEDVSAAPSRRRRGRSLRLRPAAALRRAPRRATRDRPAWINLEYLSAEDFARAQPWPALAAILRARPRA